MKFQSRKGFSAILIVLVLTAAALSITGVGIAMFYDVLDVTSNVASLHVTNEKIRVLDGTSFVSLTIKNIGTTDVILDEAVVFYDLSTLNPGTDESRSITPQAFELKPGGVTFFKAMVRELPTSLEQSIFDGARQHYFNLVSLNLNDATAEATWQKVQQDYEDAQSPIQLIKEETYLVVISGTVDGNEITESVPIITE